MNKYAKFFAVLLSFLVLGAVPVQAAPTQFLSPNYGVESVIFGGTGVLRSAEASIPPVITSGPTAINITSDSATIVWTTDKDSSSMVFFGTQTGVYTDQTGNIVDAIFVNHSVNLNNLKKGTKYFYKVRSYDDSGNIAESGENTFTTDSGDIVPPTITGGPDIAKNSASLITVTWTTNEPANSLVEYGLKDVTENSVGHTDELTLFHQVQVSGLQSSQTYLVRVKTQDSSGNTTFSATQTLQTLESPSITEVKISDITLNSALVEWKTTTPSTTIVNYGTASQTYTLNSSDTTTYITNHLVRLSNLQSGTTYYLRIVGIDQSGNRLTSDEYIFRTVILPTISNLKASEIGSSSVKLTWNSSSDIDEFIRYEITKAADPALVGKKLTTGNDALASVHTFNLSDLESGVTYAVTVLGKDVFGNQAVSPVLSFDTLPDHDPPLIQNVRTDTTVDLGSKQSVQALVSFGLSEPGIASIDYGPGAASDTYPLEVNTDTDLGISKFMVIPGLTPGDSYHFRITAKDRAGNVAHSADYLVLAPAQPVSLFDLIFGQVRANFGWLTRIGSK